MAGKGKKPKVIALVVAGGSGQRLKGAIPKQYIDLKGISVLRRSILAFLKHPKVDAVRVVIRPEDKALYAKATAGLKLLQPVHGGATRQQSVKNGLESLKEAKPSIVLIHDAARPFVPVEAICASIDAAAEHGAATVAIRCIDTILQGDADGYLQATPDRSMLWACQTPQTFRVGVIREAYRSAHAEGFLGSDDATVARRSGATVKLVEGSAFNFKVTTPSDLALATLLLQGGHV